MVCKKLQKGLFLSHSSKPVITSFVCVLCLQEKGKADGNIYQCEYTYCVQTKQHFSKYAMLCSITKSFFSSSSVILTYTLVFWLLGNAAGK